MVAPRGLSFLLYNEMVGVVGLERPQLIGGALNLLVVRIGLIYARG